MDSSSLTPVERELREAKEAIALLTRFTLQAEQGDTVDADAVQQIITRTSSRLLDLSRGVLPVSASVGGQMNSIPNEGSIPYARMGGTQVVPELKRRRAQQMLAEIDLLDASLKRSLKKKQQQSAYTSEVQQLLGSMNSTRRDNFSAIEHLENEQKGLQYARRRMQQMQAESEEVLQALKSQGARLGGAGEKLGDLLESLGVSNVTILQIVRRNQVDAWLVYGGIIFLLILMWYILY